MARIQGVPQNQAGPMTKLVYAFMRKGMKKLTGREPARGTGIEPVEVWAIRPKMMSGMGKFQGAVRKVKSFDELWEPFTFGVGPAGAYVAKLDPEQREQLRSEMFQGLGEPAGAFTLTATACAVRGVTSS